jgi:hypothetical protein
MRRREFIAGLGAAVLYTGSLVAVALSAPRFDPDFSAPTCSEFKDRLAHTQRRIAIIVPDAEYTCPAMTIDLFKTCDGFRGESAGCLGFIR